MAASHQLFWVRRGLLAHLTGLVGAGLASGQVASLPGENWPGPLRDDQAVGAVYRLDEMVLDVPSLIAALAGPHRAAIKTVAPDWRVDTQADRATILVRDGAGHERILEARRIVFAAGAGNERALAGLGQQAILAQRRPLQMLMLNPAPAPLWAHCFDRSDKPRLSITTHRCGGGALIWYVGGLLAEQGARQSERELIDAAKAEFAALLPRLDISACRFAAVRIDRAEAAGPAAAKPAGPVTRSVGAAILGWPTKLALAPRLADEVLAMLPPPAAVHDVDWLIAAGLADWPAPAQAPPPWELASWK